VPKELFPKHTKVVLHSFVLQTPSLAKELVGCFPTAKDQLSKELSCVLEVSVVVEDELRFCRDIILSTGFFVQIQPLREDLSDSIDLFSSQTTKVLQGDAP
jgi:hypothetical protein